MLIFFAAALLAPAAAAAPPVSPSSSAHVDKESARASFREGQRAFKEGDYKLAGEKFDEAYRRAPHHAPLWNAGRAWQRAGEPTRAANAYAKYLREAPANAPDRNNAIRGLKELESKVGRIEVHATGVTEVTVDGEPFEGEGVYVAPGTHVVEGKTTDTRDVVRVSPAVAAGANVSVALLPAASANAEPAPPVRAAEPSVVTPRGGISPVFVVIGGVLTLGAAGVTVWSGLDVNQQKSDYLRSADAQSPRAYDAGKSAQLRTNVLLGATGGLAALTMLTALFLVDWKGSSNGSVTVGLGPQSLFLTRTLP